MSELVFREDFINNKNNEVAVMNCSKSISNFCRKSPMKVVLIAPSMQSKAHEIRKMTVKYLELIRVCIFSLAIRKPMIKKGSEKSRKFL